MPKIPKEDDEPFVHCAHKYKEGCDVDGSTVQPWMMIVGICVLLVIGCVGPAVYKVIRAKISGGDDGDSKAEEKT